MANQLMKTMATSFDPEEFKDTYRQDVLKMIRELAKGGARKAKPKAEEEKGEPKVLDLMAALKRSVENKGKPAARSRRPLVKHRATARRSA